MAGVAKDYQTTEVHQGPGDLWVIGTAPVDGSPRLTLAANGTPDSVAHPSCVHLGALASAITTVKPKIAEIALDQMDAPIDGYSTDLDAKIEAEFYQTEMAKLQRMIGVATYATGSGYKQLTFGGPVPVPTLCIAAISPTRASNLRHVVSILFRAAAVGGFQISFGRSKASSFKCAFQGLTDVARTAGRQVGLIYQTLADAAGINPTAKDFAASEIAQGPGDLWLIDPAPLDATQRVTLDATTLTPDAAVHASARHLGATEGAITVSVTPKVGTIRFDQFEAPVDVFIESVEAKIEAEMVQSEMQKLARALGVGVFTESSGAYRQVSFGGVDQPPAICIAAVAKKRLDTTKAYVACLYRVHSVEGIQVSTSRGKANTYKVSFIGLVDTARTPGRQIGIIHEMV